MMAKKTAKKTKKDGRKRVRLSISVTADQHAEIHRKVPPKEVSEFCRNRIFMNSGFQDPVIVVGARLMGMGAMVKRFDDTVRALEGLLNNEVNRAQYVVHGADTDEFPRLLSEHRYELLSEHIQEARDFVEPLLSEAKLLRHLIAQRQEEDRRMPAVGKRGRPL